jgi:hypothetical protein
MCCLETLHDIHRHLDLVLLARLICASTTSSTSHAHRARVVMTAGFTRASLEINAAPAPPTRLHRVGQLVRISGRAFRGARHLERLQRTARSRATAPQSASQATGSVAAGAGTPAEVSVLFARTEARDEAYDHWFENGQRGADDGDVDFNAGPVCGFHAKPS